MADYRHFQFGEDGITVVGISYLSYIIEDNPNVIYFPETPENEHVTHHWRFIDGEWYAPASQFTDEMLLEQELSEIDNELKEMYNNEQFSLWIGEIQPTTFQYGLTRKQELINRRNELLSILKK